MLHASDAEHEIDARAEADQAEHHDQGLDEQPQRGRFAREIGIHRGRGPGTRRMFPRIRARCRTGFAFGFLARIRVAQPGEERFDEMVGMPAILGLRHGLILRVCRRSHKPGSLCAMLELGYVFRDPARLEQALTHASCTVSLDNERLEFLGDAVLDLVVAETLHQREPPLDEGRMTQLKADVVSRRSLAEPAKRLQLALHARLGAGLRGRAQSQAVLANLYEAIVGAIHLDGGFDAARTFIRATLADEIERALGDFSRDNPKQRFQQLCQSRFACLPVYEVIEIPPRTEPGVV